MRYDRINANSYICYISVPYEVNDSIKAALELSLKLPRTFVKLNLNE